ncbi:TIGR02302 family protein, partial [Oharaeibacter diazotrophicus]
TNPAAADDAGLTRPTAFQHALAGSGTVVLAAADGELRSFAFAVEPDRPPSIRLVEDPGATLRGALRLAYEVTDDYRVAGARAVFSEPKTPLDAAIGPRAEAPRPLVGAPELPLSLPRRNAAKPTAETIRDLSAHPWAGGTVTMRLEARDDAGATGLSAPVDVVVPARPFRNPLARALVEQRRMLALDAGSAGFVAGLLDDLTTYTPEFVDDASVHLGLRVIRARILDARSDDDLRAVLDLMWQMALAIDGGDASLAEQALREARERLREALQNGASPEEIARLTEELRKAMQEYMQALQQQMRDNPDLAQSQPPPDENAQTVSPEDFQKMIDRIEEMSKLGDREAAEQLLSQLDRMLENLQTAQPRQGQPQKGQQGQGQQMMNELADMIRRQQELMNQTHKLTPDGRPQDGQGMSSEEMQQAMRDLQQGQQDLEKRLQDLMKQMEKNGMQPGGELGEAQGSMKGAQGSLGDGEPDDALGQQGRALDQLRKGAQQLADQMGEQDGEGRGRRGESARGEDPLGRPERRDGPDFGDSVKVPGEIEVQRARRILEELRRRFSEPDRPAIELDYLQRLLNPF